LFQNHGLIEGAAPTIHFHSLDNMLAANRAACLFKENCMSAFVRTSHRVYKRYQSLFEAAITSLCLALLVGLALFNLPVYPPNWAPVAAAVIALVGFRWPLAAYLLTIGVLLYPIYTLSLYLAILFLAVAIVVHRPAGHYLGATILVVSTPLLAKFHLHWIVPVLAGLWWGSINGFWIGGTAALWGKLLNGMAGLDNDWLLIAGQSPTVAGLMQRFNGLGSLETLTRLVEPFAPDTTLLLYHLLQIAVWALVAGLVGFLANQKWLYHHYPWSTVIVSGLGIVTLGLGLLFLAAWLREVDLTVLNYQPLLVVAVAGLTVSSTLEVLRQALELPVAPNVHRRVISVPVPRRQSGGEVASASATQHGQSKPTPVPLPDLPEWEPPAEDNNDLILLELD
jgi:hypothetical protein